MANEQSRQWLYNKLTGVGCDLGGDYASWCAKMDSSAESRQWCYNKAKSLGWDVGTFESFEQKIGPDVSATASASSSAPTAPAKAAASSSASASPHDSKQAGSGASAPLGSSAVIESQSSGTELLADFAAAMQGDWRDSLGTQAR